MSLEGIKKFCSFSQAEFEIIHPDYTLDVEANEEYWYGLYYDQNGNLQYLILHEKDENEGRVSMRMLPGPMRFMSGI